MIKGRIGELFATKAATKQIKWNKLRNCNPLIHITWNGDRAVYGSQLDTTTHIVVGRRRPERRMAILSTLSVCDYCKNARPLNNSFGICKSNNSSQCTGDSHFVTHWWDRGRQTTKAKGAAEAIFLLNRQ